MFFFIIFRQNNNFEMGKTFKISIIASFFSLWISNLIKNEYQIYVGFFLILFFGIIHGANDIVLLNNINANKKNNFISTLVKYVLVILVFTFVFILNPLFALAIFIVLSSYHFGEQHFKDLSQYKIEIFKYIHHTIYGLFILFLLFMIHPNEVNQIVFQITGFENVKLFIIPSFIFISIILFILLVFSFIKNKSFRLNLPLELFLLVIFGVLFKLGSLIWGFAIYFIFWHSLPSIYDQVVFLYKDFTKQTLTKYIQSALPYWVVSIIGLIILYFFLKESKHFDSILFSFLAAITFPHVFVIKSMFRK